VIAVFIMSLIVDLHPYFYVSEDRKPRRKHMAGPFFTEGSFTKNTEQEVDVMMEKLGEWVDDSRRPSPKESARLAALKKPLVAMSKRVSVILISVLLNAFFMKDWSKILDLFLKIYLDSFRLSQVSVGQFMGTWHVTGVIPTVFEVGASNPREKYSWNAERNCIDVVFDYVPQGAKAYSQILQRGMVVRYEYCGLYFDLF
jgi:hypothetical protein